MDDKAMVSEAALRQQWTIVMGSERERRETMEQALALCRGRYQEGIIYGDENLSGSTLSGEAKKWSGRYAASRESLFRRLREARIPHCEVRGPHGRRVLVLGARRVRIV